MQAGTVPGRVVPDGRPVDHPRVAVDGRTRYPRRPGELDRIRRRAGRGRRGHWYAVAFKAGVQLQWTGDESGGQSVDGPHCEERRIAAVYVRGDGERAVVRDYRAEREGGGWRPVASEFRAIRAFPPDAGGAVSRPNKQCYRAALEEYYDVDHRVDRAIRNEGGEPA